MLLLDRVQRVLHQTRHALVAPSRSPRTAVVLGRLLGAAFVVCFATGVYSHLIQDPLPGLPFPTRPVWLYRVTQGVHITAGLACIPLLLGKLYAVYRELFRWPPVRSPLHLLERASIALFVAASLTEVAIGLLNTYQFYALFGFSFRATHFALAFVVVGSLAIHIAVKLPVIQRYWRGGAATEALIAGHEREDPDAVLDVRDEVWRRTGRDQLSGLTGRVSAWIDREPAPSATGRDGRVGRRAFFGTIAAAVGALLVTTAGQSVTPLAALDVLGPRRPGVGPQRLPVNKTARAAGVLARAMSPDWRLTVSGGTATRTFSLADLRALPQHDVTLPIACVEGWSQSADWSGPRVRDLMDAAGIPASMGLHVISLEERGGSARTLLEPEFASDDLTLVALRLHGEPLDIDHGYPARLIAPARPGVLQTKWLDRFEAAPGGEG